MNRALLPLKAGEGWVALEAGSAREVLGRSAWTPLPGCPAYLPGVLAWRGRAIAVLDLAGLLGAPALEPGAGRERTVIVEVGGCTVGVPADAVREVADVPADQVRAPHASQVRFCTGEVELHGATVAVLDLEAVLGEVAPRERR